MVMPSMPDSTDTTQMTGHITDRADAFAQKMRPQAVQDTRTEDQKLADLAQEYDPVSSMIRARSNAKGPSKGSSFEDSFKQGYKPTNIKYDIDVGESDARGYDETSGRVYYKAGGWSDVRNHIKSADAPADVAPGYKTVSANDPIKPHGAPRGDIEEGA